MSELGPGAARAMAKMSANCVGVIQPHTPTVWCCMSATIAWPPPKERIDSGANTMMSPRRRLASTLRLLVGEPGDRETEWHADDHHRHHGDVIDADRHEGGEPDEDGRNMPLHVRGHLG